MTAAEDPSDWVVEHLGLIPAGGTAVDVAAGRGRHTRLLRARGHPVVAIDVDTTVLDPGPPSPVGIEVVTADLEAAVGSGDGWPLGGRRFAAVVVTRYLHRPLLPVLADAVEPGGVLLYETFMEGHPAVGGRPSNADYLLRPGELLEVARAAGLQVIDHREGAVALPRPSILQAVAAIRPLAG